MYYFELRKIKNKILHLACDPPEQHSKLTSEDFDHLVLTLLTLVLLASFTFPLFEQEIVGT